MTLLVAGLVLFLGAHSVRIFADGWRARTIARQNRYDDCFFDTLDVPPQRKTFGGAIGHLITQNMHHRAHILFLLEQVGIKEHLEGDLLTWESIAFGWNTQE